MKINTNPSVTEKFKTYKPKVRKRLKHLRSLIIDEAKSLEHMWVLLKRSMERPLSMRRPEHLFLDWIVNCLKRNCGLVSERRCRIIWWRMR